MGTGLGKPGARWVRASSCSAGALVSAAALLFAGQALADAECGAPVNGAVACTSAGNPYANGVTYSPTGSLNVTVASGTVIQGAVNGVTLNASGAQTLVNNGSISGIALGGTTTGFAVSSTGGSMSLTNNGTITGQLNLSALGNKFINTGTFITAGINDLGVGSTTATNKGTISVPAVGLFPTETVALIGPGTFNNSGLLDLRNGRAGDSLRLAGTFVATGSSQVGLDVQLGAAGALADKLIVTAPTGVTTLLVADISKGYGALNPGLVLVQASAGATASNFVLQNGPITKGFVQYNLVFNGANFTYSLVGVPDAAAYQSLKLIAGVENVWRASSDAWSDHMAELRDANWAGGRAALSDGVHLWAQAFGAGHRQSDSESYTVFGQTSAVNLGYRQTTGGFETGVEAATHRGAVALVGGLTTGFTYSSLDFEGASGGGDYTSPNIGAYASLLDGPLFANLLLKYDHDGVSAKSALAQYSHNFNGDGYGATIEAGYRLGLGRNLYLEPLGSLNYVHTHLDGFSALGAGFDFNDTDALEGRAGLRAGGRYALAGGGTLSPYVGAEAVGAFSGRDALDFSSGGYGLHFTDRRPLTYGDANVGVNFAGWRGLSGFVQLDGDFAGRTQGVGGSLGLRLAL
jgi:outer membrane autotransporter protein